MTGIINLLEQCLIGIECLYAFATALPKLSLLFLYLRIFPSRSFRFAVYVVIFSVVGLGCAIFFTAIFPCSPVAYAWDKTVRGGTCIDELAFFRWSTPPNLIIDLVMLTIPMPMVWNLHASYAQKAGLTCVFLTGSVGIIAACVRMSAFFQKNAFEDVTRTAVSLVNWTVIEPGCYLIAACLPSFRPIFIQIFNLTRALVPTNAKSITGYRSSFSSSRKTKSGRLDVTGLANSHTTVSGALQNHSTDQNWDGPDHDGVPLNSWKKLC